MNMLVPEHRAEPIEMRGEWAIKRECRICAFYGVRVVIQRRGLFRRWRHVE